jgi:hypothetical protein
VRVFALSQPLRALFVCCFFGSRCATFKQRFAVRITPLAHRSSVFCVFLLSVCVTAVKRIFAAGVCTSTFFFYLFLLFFFFLKSILLWRNLCTCACVIVALTRAPKIASFPFLCAFNYAGPARRGPLTSEIPFPLSDV